MTIEEKFQTIDKFYLSLTIILILMAVLLIFSFRGVFSMFLNAYEVDPNLTGASVNVDKEKFEEAKNFAFERTPIELKAIPTIKPEPTIRP